MPAAVADDLLLQCFEDGSLPFEEWTHTAHVRVGFLYASQFPLETAILKMREGLKAYNARHNVPDQLDRGYHETITVAFMRLIQQRTIGRWFESSDQFCHANGDLMDKRALLRFYSRDRIMSAEAKRAFIEPDLAPLVSAPPEG